MTELVDEQEVDEQEAIARCDATQLLVVAPPGCGKTELLAKRVRVLIDRLDRNQRILALTFSNKARQNLQVRLIDTIGVARARRVVAVQNFHGLAAALIRAHGRTVGLDPKYRMPVRTTLSSAIKPYTAGLAVGPMMELQKRVESSLRMVKQQPITDSEVLQRLEEEDDPIALAVERQRQSSGVLHYDDLLRHAQRLLNIAPVARLYQHHYGAVIVDEFQDLSLQQLDLALLSAHSSRVFVGDPLQGIYTWAGADPQEVERRLIEICGPPFRLRTSYRSSPAVLQTLGSVSVTLGGHLLQAHDPGSWLQGGISAAVTFPTALTEAEWIVVTATEILAKRPWSTIGVISRAAWRRRVVDEAFANSAVDHTRWDSPIDDPVIAKIIQDAARRLPPSSTVLDLREKVLSTADATDVETYQELVEAFDQLEFASGNAASARSAVGQWRTGESSLVLTPGVHLLNAHTGKGQQFDWVFIPGFEGFHIPSGQAQTMQERAEERRVLLVMLSRARHGVVVSRATTLIAKSGKAYSPNISEYWNLVADSCGSTLSDVSRHIEEIS